MRLGSAGEWSLASQLMGRGIDEAKNTIRGGTIQEIKTRNLKKYAADILTLMRMNDPRAITPEILMSHAEKYDLDPVEASGILDVIMGFQEKMGARKQKQELLGSLPLDEQRAVKLKEYFDYTKPKVEDPNIALNRALDVQKKRLNIKQHPQKMKDAETARETKTAVETRAKESHGIKKDKVEIERQKRINNATKTVQSIDNAINNVKNGIPTQGLAAALGIALPQLGTALKDPAARNRLLQTLQARRAMIIRQIPEADRKPFEMSTIPTGSSKLQGSMGELIKIGRQ